MSKIMKMGKAVKGNLDHSVLRNENIKGAGVERDCTFLAYTSSREKESDTLPARKEKPPDKLSLVVSKWIGLEGTFLIAREREKELLRRYPPGIIRAAREQKKWLLTEKEAAIAFRSGTYAVYAVGVGGIFGALWELSQKLGAGFCVNLTRIPVRQETIEICEFYRLNPYELLSGGMLLMATADAGTLMEALEEADIPCSLIGTTNAGNDKVVRNGENIRYLGPVVSDEIIKILKTGGEFHEGADFGDNRKEQQDRYEGAGSDPGCGGDHHCK